MREDRAVLMDIEVKPDGILSESTWYSRHSVAEIRKKG